MHRRFAVATMILAGSSPALAGSIEDPICTDRPGKSSSTCAAPKSHWQFETGMVNWSETKGQGSTSTTLKLLETSIKYGVSDTTHIELVINPFVRSTSKDATAKTRHDGIGDTKVKVKQELTKSGSAFSAAIYPFVKIPTANRKIGNGHVEAGLVIPLGLSFAKSPLSLAASPEIDWSLDSDRHGYHPVMQQTLSLGLQATKELSFSAELWGQWDWDDGKTTRQYSFDPTMSYDVNKNLQLDLGANIGLNKKTADLEVSGGMSVLF